MDTPKTADIVIIGGGVMGASAAYHLAKRGMKNIVLLEKEEFFGTGATGRCAGGVRYQFSTEINVKLSLESLPMLECFKEEIGQDVNYRQCGYLLIATNEKDAAAFKHNVELQNRLGVQTQLLSGDEVRARLPLMRFEDAIAGTFHQKDGLVDPNSVVAGYVRAAQKLGVKALTRAEVTGIRVSGGEVEAVETTQGSDPDAHGPERGGTLGRMDRRDGGSPDPDRPAPQTDVHHKHVEGNPRRFSLRDRFCAVALFPPRRRWIADRDEQSKMKSPASIRMWMKSSSWRTSKQRSERMPLLEQASRASHWAGLYEVTPDAHPIFGGSPVKGFTICAGFSGHGFMHGPVAGKLMTEYILDGAFSTVDVSMLDLARFEEGRLIKEYNVV